MDGFIPVDMVRRRTLKTSISCVGVGVHSGRRASLVLRPALAGTGIRFRRTDLGLDIPARYDMVADTRLCTALARADRPEARIGTVEHVMAALAGTGIHDAIIEIDGPEVPILDGSAAPFVFLIDCAGIATNPGMVEMIEVLRPVRVQDGDGPDAPWVELSPLPAGSGSGLEASIGIDFRGTAIGRQQLSLRITPDSFRHALADARTFTLAAEVEHLRALGLAQGGNLSNAVVVDGPVVLNPGGLRRPDEFVRHKMLDVVGDLALAGAPLCARFSGYRSGHALNNRLLRALFADDTAWRYQGESIERVSDGAAAAPLRAAAYPAMA